MLDRACRFFLAAAFAAAAAAGGTALAKTKERKPPPQTGTLDAAGSYHMSKDELAMDCKRLTGKMQVRILQIRDYDPARNSSQIGRSLQALHAPLIGGSTVGSDPDARYRADRAMLTAYNHRLAEKKCRTFDLEAELKPKPVGSTPTPTAPAARKP